MMDLGDRRASSTVRFMWDTSAVAGGSITRATNGSIRIYKDDSTTERTSAAGITDTEDFDTLTGVHHCKIDLSDNTDAGFYAAGHDYFAVLAGAVIDGQTVNVPLAQFSIENRNPQVDVTKLGGVAQSLTDLKDFADTGYDPATHKVAGVVLVDTATTVTNNVNAVLANAAHGGVAATITFERLIGVSTTTDEPAVKLTGNGAGAGMRCIGGTAGHGIYASASGTGGNGLRVQGGTGTASHGIYTTGGTGTGVAGMKADSGSTTGVGIHAVGNQFGHGIQAVGGTSGGAGVLASGGGNGAGLDLVGGPTNGPGLFTDGGGTGPGFLTRGAGGGNGIEILGRSDGAGTDGHGIVLTRGGTTKDDVFLTNSDAPTLKAAILTAGAIDSTVAPNLDAAISTRLASASYTAPLDAAGVRTAVGLASANLDTQLSGINSKTSNLPASPAAVGSAMTLANGSITEATITTPAETAGRPTGILAMMRRIFEWKTNKRIRTRATGALQLRNAADSADLETQNQSTAGGVGSEVDTQTKGV